MSIDFTILTTDHKLGNSVSKHKKLDIHNTHNSYVIKQITLTDI